MTFSLPLSLKSFASTGSASKPRRPLDDGHYGHQKVEGLKNEPDFFVPDRRFTVMNGEALLDGNFHFTKSSPEFVDETLSFDPGKNIIEGH
jgi:hypothetical protein